MMKSLISRWPSASSAMTFGAIGLAMIFCAACGVKAYPGHLPEPEGSSGGSSGQASSASGGQSSNSSASAGGQSSSAGRGGDSSSSGGAGASGGQSSSEGGQSEGGSSSQSDTSSSSAGGGNSGGKSSSGGASSSSGGSTASGTGVTINGKFVAKEKAVTFIHIGHSNMRGQATKPTSLKDYFYTTEDGLWSYKAKFFLAKEPTAPEGDQTYAGPGMAILHSARAAVGTGSDVQFISIGFGIGSKTSVDYQKGGSYYKTFMGWAGELKGKVTFGALVIMLGITERHLSDDLLPKFPDRIAQLVSDIRSDLGEPALPVLFCDYEQLATGDLAPTETWGKKIMPLVRQIPDKVTNLVLVPTDNLSMQDDHHFDMQGHKDWAGRVISLMQTKGWFPWK
jgi:hypothetical protein